MQKHFQTKTVTYLSKQINLGTYVFVWVHNKRRAGGPRLSWTQERVKEIWDYIKKDNPGYRFTAFDGEKEDIIELIRTYARGSEATSTR